MHMFIESMTLGKDFFHQQYHPTSLLSVFLSHNAKSVKIEKVPGTLTEGKKGNFSSHKNPGFQQTKTTNPWPFGGSNDRQKIKWAKVQGPANLRTHRDKGALLNIDEEKVKGVKIVYETRYC